MRLIRWWRSLPTDEHRALVYCAGGIASLFSTLGFTLYLLRGF